jgi:hypothetical protein
MSPAMADSTLLPIRLRSDVRVVRSGPREFALVDSANALYLGLDLEAHRVLRLLESCATIDEVVAGYQVAHGAVIERENVEAQLERLRTLGLLQDIVAELHPTRLPEPPFAPALQSDPKANLNAAFDLLVVLFGWLLHPVCLAPVAVLALLAGTAILHEWPDWLARQYDTLQSVPFPLVLLTTYLQTLVFFNLPNVLMLGMACRRFGGRVEAFGMQLWQGVVPVFHLDIGDSIPLLSERGRWSLVTAAFATPLALGSCYTLCWAISRDQGKAAAFWALSMPVAAVSLLLQCNPGSKTSAIYWALSLAYEDSQILERARAEALAWLGGPASVEPLSPSDRRWLRCAGLLSYVWSGLLTVAVWGGLAWWFTTRLQGVGAAIVLLLFALFVRSKLAAPAPTMGAVSAS